MLYRLNSQEIESSTRIEITTPAHFDIKEKDIENFLKSRTHELVSEEHLMLIGQERSWQEEADLLALDRDGVLYIFELKRWESKPENILQVLRYGQIFGRKTYEELQDLATQHGKIQGCLQEKHQEFFELKEPVTRENFNQDQVFVLITNGTDRETISAVEYWSHKGVKIACAPYRIYDIGGDPYMQFDTYNPKDDVLPEDNPGFFIVNTNRSSDPHAWREMLGNLDTGKGAAYYGRKYAVCRIPKRSTVYLYHTRIGVIAKGETTDIHQKADRDGNRDEEFFVPLKFEWALPERDWGRKAVPAWRINQKLGSGYRFRHTVFAVSNDVADAIDKIYGASSSP